MQNTIKARGRRGRWLTVIATSASALLVVAASAWAASPPKAITSAPDLTLLTDSYALLSGTVQPNGTATSYWFEWGTSTTYGNVTPTTSAGNGTAAGCCPCAARAIRVAGRDRR